MCGIFGYIGPRDAAQICLDGLKHLEYRGYDSAGLAGILEGKLLTCKESGKIHALETLWQQNPKRLDLAIAHTRWATHGKPSRENAHPHFDPEQNVAVIHNGIIENHRALRILLKEQGCTFTSETDSEIIAQLIHLAYLATGNFLTAVRHTLLQLQGSWGLAIIHKNHPDQMIVAARENPIAIAHNADRTEVFISSDANAFRSSDLDILFLQSGELALITSGKAEIFDHKDVPIIKATEKLKLDSSFASRDGYPHYMLKEIFEQPETIHQAMYNRFIEDFGTAEFEGLTIPISELQSVKRILILACGTSWHAGAIASLLLEDMARIPTHAEIASEFRYKNPIISRGTLVIAISQSGETLDTIAAVREAKAKGAKVLGICNVRHSTLTREADACLFLRAGPEISVCSTKAFTSQLTVLALFSLLMSRMRHMPKEEGQAFLHSLRQLPDLVHEVLHQDAEIARLAHKYAHFEHFFFLGRHYMYTTCLEGALKLKEISYLNAVGYPAGEMKHGPIALISPEVATIAFCGNERTAEKMASNLMEIKARSGPILAFAPQGSDLTGIADDIFLLPRVTDALAPILYSTAAQLFAYHIACWRGTEIDQPRNLAKSVTVE